MTTTNKTRPAKRTTHKPFLINAGDEIILKLLRHITDGRKKNSKAADTNAKASAHVTHLASLKPSIQQ